MKLMSPVLALMAAATAKAGISRICNLDAVEHAGEKFYQSVLESWPAETNYLAAPTHQEDEFLKIALSQFQQTSSEKQELYQLGVPCLSSENTRQGVSAIINDVNRRLTNKRQIFFADPAHAKVRQNTSEKQQKLEGGIAKLKKQNSNFDASPYLRMPSSQPISQPRNRKKRHYHDRDEL